MRFFFVFFFGGGNDRYLGRKVDFLILLMIKPNGQTENEK